MTDPLSITAGILSILDFTKRVIRWGSDVKNAPKERRQFVEELECLNFLLEKLDERYKTAPKDEMWLRGLWGWREELDKNKVLVRKPKGVVPQLQVAIAEMALKLDPESKKLWELTWHWSKEKLAEMLKDIYRYCDVIRKILDLKQDEALDSIQENAKMIIKISENTTVQLESVSVDTKLIIKDGEDAKVDRARLEMNLGILQDEQRRQSEKLNAESEKAEKAREEQRGQWERERRLKDDEERTAIAFWLSPLADLARQDELFTECFQDTGEWLLESVTFKDWVEGRPMHLRCFGQPGVGKVCSESHA